MRSGMACFLFTPTLLFAAAVVWAAPPNEPADTPRIVNLTVDATPEPIPAFKYRLRVHYVDQTPGNAALQYHTAMELYLQNAKPEDGDKISGWLDVPLEELPVEAARTLVQQFSSAMDQTRLAAHCERCDWEYPIRQRGIDTLLPNLSSLRAIARLFALQARLDLRANNLNAAIENLSVGYAMAKHACDSPVLIGDLVGYAIAGVMHRQVALCIQAPQAANLYWALTDLPAPLKDPRQFLGGEEAWLYFSIPELRPSAAKLSPAEWNRVSEKIGRMMGMVSGDEHGIASWPTKLSATAIALKLYPQAKRDLVTYGYRPEEVEAMPAQQVVIMAGHEVFVRQRDDMFKWFSVPFWQARPRLAEIERQLHQSRDTLEGYPFATLLPALTNAYYSATRCERELAALRCVEAVRLYAAAHRGQLPKSLAEITAVPVPIDPMTGKDFTYQLEGGRTTLIAAQPEGKPLKDEVHYVITVRKP